MGLRVASMKRRKLSPEEMRLWEKVAKSTFPLNEKYSSETESHSNNETPKGAPLKGMKFHLVFAASKTSLELIFNSLLSIITSFTKAILISL